MGFDAVLKRVFPAVVLALIGIAAYFQASGIGQILATASVDPKDGVAQTAPPKRAQTPLLAKTDHATSGTAILHRNPFDSTTGPLDQIAPDAPPPVDDTDPDDSPACEGGRVVLITWSEEPEWSFASIAGGDGKSSLRRRGDKVDGRVVDRIEWDRVWLAGDTGRKCQLLMGAAMSKGKPPAPAKPPPDLGGGPKTIVPEKIASRIHMIDSGHVTVERSVISDVMELQAELFRSVRLGPDKDGGLRLTRVPKGSLVEMLGLKSGDRVQTINGIDVSNPANAAGALIQLQQASKLSVALQRDGKPASIEVQIQ